MSVPETLNAQYERHLPMEVSIALATMNGAGFLRTQLESFCSQTRLPDQLVVTDDGSTDGTVEIVEQIAATAPFEVVLHRNGTNLGVTKNFENAISRCSGEIVFLSDQDDIWFPDKIERVLATFEAHPTTQLVINDARIVDASATPTPLTKLGQTRSLGLSDDHFINGCCSTLRASFLNVLLPFPEGVAHDMWIHQLSLRLGLRVVCDEVLQDFRRHGDNVSRGLSSQTRKASKLDLAASNMRKNTACWCEMNLQRLELLRSRLQEHEADLLADYVSACDFERIMGGIDREGRAVKARWKIVESPRLNRLVPAMKMLIRGDYNVFSGWQSFLKDIVLH